MFFKDLLFVSLFTTPRTGKKLKTMEVEMKRLQSAQREHDKLVKMNKDNAKNLKTLQTEVCQEPKKSRLR